MNNPILLHSLLMIQQISCGQTLQTLAVLRDSKCSHKQ